MKDQQTRLEELKLVVKSFCEQRDWDQFHNAKELSIGVITEASELLEHFRFLTEEQIAAVMDDPEKRLAISEELSDVLFFLVRFAQRYDFDLSESFTAKMTKNARKYPVSDFKGKNHKSTIS